MRLENKVAIVTGSAMGIGKATAKVLALEGATIVLNDINEEALRMTEQELLSTGSKVLAIKASVCIREEVEQIVEQVIAENPKAVADATDGGKKSKASFGFLMGQVMQKTKGQANPKIVSGILAQKLS